MNEIREPSKLGAPEQLAAQSPPGPPDSASAPELIDHVPARRMRGLPLLALIVLAGLVPTSIYFHWKVPGVIEEFRRLVESERQRTPEERLALWFQMNAPQVHNRLRQLRLGADQPWLVAYGVGPVRKGEPVEVVGIDFSDFAFDAVQLDGMVVRVLLEAPEPLGRHTLRGSQAINVPIYPDAAAAPEPRARIAAIVDYAMRHPDDFLEALVEDNPGASFRLVIGGEEHVLAESAHEAAGEPAEG